MLWGLGTLRPQIWPDVGIGRQEGLKNLWAIARAGSTPAPATTPLGECQYL